MQTETCSCNIRTIKRIVCVILVICLLFGSSLPMVLADDTATIDSGDSAELFEGTEPDADHENIHEHEMFDFSFYQSDFPARELEDSTESPAYICTFGCTHDPELPCNLPEVEVIFAKEQTMFLAKGVRMAAADVIDLTDLEGGEHAILPCIWVHEYNDSQHFERCLNHHDSSTHNGILHISGKRNVANHTLTTTGTASCSDAFANQVQSCGGCAYHKTLPKPAHVKENNLLTNSNLRRHIYRCAVCLVSLTYEPCVLASGELITCSTTGVCSACGFNYSNSSDIRLEGPHYSYDANADFIDIGKCTICGQEIVSTIHVSPTVKTMTTWTRDVELSLAPGSAWGREPTVYTTNNAATSVSMLSSNANSRTYRITTDVSAVTTTNLAANQNYVFFYFTNSSNNYNYVVNVGGAIDITPPTYISHAITPSGTEWSNSRQLAVTVDETKSATVQIGVFHQDGTVAIPYGAAVKNGITFTRNMALALETNGSSTFLVRAKDEAGNVMDRPITITNVDFKAPTLQPPPNLTNTWSKTKTVTFTAHDEGIGQVQIAFNDESDYQLAAQSGQNYTRTYTFTGNVGEKQTHPLYLKDGLGNVATFLIEIDKLDNTPPTATHTVSHDDWTNAEVTIHITASDNLSGIASIKKPNGVTEHNIATATQVVTHNGLYTFEITDKAGNQIAYTVPVSIIDGDAPSKPTTEVTVKGDGTRVVEDWVNHPILVSMTSESASGIKYYEYQVQQQDIIRLLTVDDDHWIQNDGKVEIEDEGIFSVFLRAIDNAGNISPMHEEVVRIDLTPPETTHSVDGGSIHLTVADELSGVAKIICEHGTIVSQNEVSCTMPTGTSGEHDYQIYDVAGNMIPLTVSYTAPDDSGGGSGGGSDGGGSDDGGSDDSRKLIPTVQKPSKPAEPTPIVKTPNTPAPSGQVPNTPTPTVVVPPSDQENILALEDLLTLLQQPDAIELLDQLIGDRVQKAIEDAAWNSRDDALGVELLDILSKRNDSIDAIGKDLGLVGRRATIWIFLGFVLVSMTMLVCTLLSNQNRKSVAARLPMLISQPAPLRTDYAQAFPCQPQSMEKEVFFADDDPAQFDSFSPEHMESDAGTPPQDHVDAIIDLPAGHAEADQDANEIVFDFLSGIDASKSTSPNFTLDEHGDVVPRQFDKEVKADV